VIAGTCEASLDVRHADDAIRTAAVSALVDRARQIAGRRGIELHCASRLDQQSVPMDGTLTALMAQAIESRGVPVVHIASGAGHDAMVMARCMPVAMLFMRSPGGISHRPDEDVREEDVAAALGVGESWLTLLARSRSW
jgi:allantoate deiminase